MAFHGSLTKKMEEMFQDLVGEGVKVRAYNEAAKHVPIEVLDILTPALLYHRQHYIFEMVMPILFKRLKEAGRIDLVDDLVDRYAR